MKVVNSDKKIKIRKNNIVKEYDPLFTFKCEQNGRFYIGYTDNSIAVNGRKNIYASAYDPNLNQEVLEPITDSEELKMINLVLQQIDESVKQ